MAIDKRKFNEKSFVQQVPMELFREFLTPWQSEIKGLKLDKLEADTLYDWLTNADASYPADLMEALHRMNDVRSHACADRIMGLAEEAGLIGELVVDGVATPMAELVMRCYLRARNAVFERVWNEEFLHSLQLSHDRVAAEERPLCVTSKKLEAFRRSAVELVTRNHRGSYCSVNHYEDNDGGYFIIRHGWWPERRSIVKGNQEAVISYQPLKQDVIHYDAATGLFRMKTATRKAEDQEALRDAFAEHLLGDKTLFQHEEATNLYTLEPLRRDGTAFRFGAGLMEGDVARVVEIKVARGEGSKRVVNVVTSRDTLVELANGYDKIDLTQDEIISAKFKFRLMRDGRTIRKTVIIKPPCVCQFSTNAYPDTFRGILEANGFILQKSRVAEAA